MKHDYLNTYEVVFGFNKDKLSRNWKKFFQVEFWETSWYQFAAPDAFNGWSIEKEPYRALLFPKWLLLHICKFYHNCLGVKYI